MTDGLFTGRAEAGEPLAYNIPAGHGFAVALAQGLIEQTGGDPMRLSALTLLLPSRRACRTLRETFLRLSDGSALLLPQMHPVGDVDADEMSLRLAAAGGIDDIPSAMTPLERQLLLARLIRQSDAEMSFDQAVALAQALGRFLDEVETEGLSFDKLEGLVPDAFAAHWQKTLAFLKIVTEHWPRVLAERGMVDGARRRNLLLHAQAALWSAHPPAGPVIAAGSTGTVPAARALLGVVARLPQGCIVLPGLDLDLEEEAWSRIGGEHPQHSLKELLSSLPLSRGDVRTWEVKKTFPVNKARARLLSEALRPAETTDRWRRLTPADIPPQALEGFTRIDCATPQEEADMIALLMRETLEAPGKTAALVTPDRRLARRVSLSLARWGIRVDDSGGQPLTELLAGTWLMLAAEAAEAAFAPVTLLSFLKHPLMAASLPPEELRGMVYLLDKLVLRGPRPAPGLDGLRAAIESESASGHDAGGDRAEARARLLRWLSDIEPAMRGFAGLMASGEPCAFGTLLEAHLRAAEALAATQDKAGGERVWRAEAGEAAAALFENLRRAAPDVPGLLPVHYVALLRLLLKSVTVRPRYGAHPRLSILGQIEARLFSADRVILGGLNEGAWPELPAHDPWMSRPMRRDFGLPAPEQAICLAAHDFTQAAASHEVFLTRAQKVDGTPTVPARWLLRLETVLSAVGMEWPVSDAARYRRWLRALDTPAAVVPAQRPSPCPPVSARPRRLSVTQIETWMRDPYQIYARHVLGLRALEDIDADPAGAERGTFIHAALENFIRAFPEDLPDDAEARLLSFGRDALSAMRIPPEVEAYWWPRFERVACRFVQEEKEWRKEAVPCRTEISGVFAINAPAGVFTLTGKADRIDRMQDGGYAIIDYKSGAAPLPAEVGRGLSPQLPLEALMLENGGFPGLEGRVSALSYWQVTGSGQDPVKRKAVMPKDMTVADLVGAADAGLQELVTRFDDPATPYICQPRADALPRFSDYDHLARVREWGLSGDDGEGDA